MGILHAWRLRASPMRLAQLPLSYPHCSSLTISLSNGPTELAAPRHRVGPTVGSLLLWSSALAVTGWATFSLLSIGSLDFCLRAPFDRSSPVRSGLVFGAFCPGSPSFTVYCPLRPPSAIILLILEKNWWLKVMIWPLAGDPVVPFLLLLCRS